MGSDQLFKKKKFRKTKDRARGVNCSNISSTMNTIPCHEYLRARKGSSVNSSLEKLVVKDPKKGQKQESHVNVSQTKSDKEKMDVVY